MSPLRDLLVAPRPADGTLEDAPRPEALARGRLRLLRRTRAAPSATRALAPSLGLLSPARELPAAAAAAGLALARGAPAALVCLHAPGATAHAPSLRAPARAGAARLAASLAARGLAAEARGRLALVALPDDPGECVSAAARALAAAGALPTVLAVGIRDADVDVLLAAQGAILVALAPSTEPTLAALALAGAADLAPSAAAVSLALDPVARTLALAGLRAPRAIRHAVDGLIA